MCLFVCLFVCLAVCLFGCLFVCLFVCVCVWGRVVCERVVCDKVRRSGGEAAVAALDGWEYTTEKQEHNDVGIQKRVYYDYYAKTGHTN